MTDPAPIWPGPLAGVRVLDFTRVIAGPSASLALADLGEMVVEVEHRMPGTVPIVNRPFRCPGVAQPKPGAPPALGQHSDEILRDVLGLDAGRIAALRAGGAIAWRAAMAGRATFDGCPTGRIGRIRLPRQAPKIGQETGTWTSRT